MLNIIDNTPHRLLLLFHHASLRAASPPRQLAAAAAALLVIFNTIALPMNECQPSAINVQCQYQTFFTVISRSTMSQLPVAREMR